jgi:membrane protein DedA with SNARE-associated domain
VESFVQHYGYFALILLSLATSACIPIPSEITYVVAGALCTTAVTGHVQFTLWAVIVSCSLSALVGSQIAYELGRSAGRPVVERWGKWLLLGPHDLDRSERWFEKYSSATVLFGRLVPFVRSFISVPAGIAEMSRVRFATLTLLGSAAWVSLLASLGDAAGSNWHRVSGDFKDAEWPTIIVLAVLVIAAFLHRLRSVRRQNALVRET